MWAAGVTAQEVSRLEDTVDETSLCAPCPDLSCFGCCPPIRPSHYEPLDYVRSLRREFLENRLRLLRDGPVEHPIVGYSCWALGYLDNRGRSIGCLLHPSLHGGKDLRDLTGYGAKCRRESCTPAIFYARLSGEGRRFWLSLVRGLSPFYFSSRRANPLFHLMLWGPEVLEPMRALSETMGWSATEILVQSPFLLSPDWMPQAHRYLYRLLLQGQDPPVSDPCSLENSCRQLLIFARETIHIQAHTGRDAIYTHLLPMEDDFLDFLRLGLRLEKISKESAVELRARFEEAARMVAAHMG